MTTVRDQARAKILNEKVRKAVVELEDGVKVEVRQMTVGQMLDVSAETDNRQRMAKYLIACCFVPGTEEHIFEEPDFDQLMQLPAGGYYQRLIDAINSQLLPQQLEEAGKGSSGTPTST